MIPFKDNIPRLGFPFLTAALLLLDVVVYLLSIRHGGSFLDGPSPRTAVRHGAIPYELTHPDGHCALGFIKDGPAHLEAWGSLCLSDRSFPGGLGPQTPTWQTTLSSLALHGSFVSLLADAVAIAIFGPTVEAALGRLRFLALCLLGGLFVLGVQVALGPNSPLPAFLAPGAVAVVLGVYLRLHPRARVVSLVLIPTFATIVEVPAALLLGLWLLVQLWFALVGLAGPGEGWLGAAELEMFVRGGWIIPFAATLAGFLAGVLLAPLLVRGQRRGAKAEPTPLGPVY
jgi:membrane associated rhomboid family serine protease